MNELMEQIKRAEEIIDKKELNEQDILNLKMQLFNIASAGNLATSREIYEASIYTESYAIEYANKSDSLVVKLLASIFLKDGTD